MMNVDSDEFRKLNENANARYFVPGLRYDVRREYGRKMDLSWQVQVREFMIGAAEMGVQFGRGCKDIVRQNLASEDSFVVRKIGRNSYIRRKIRYISDRTWMKLKPCNELLPEDKDPVHVWSVICFVVALALAGLMMNTNRDVSVLMVKDVFIHPPSANRILLPDGRYLAYKEQGVSSDRARFTMIAPHTFISSRLAGIPGLKASLLEEFGIHFVTYDLPGFGESDPHPDRDLESSAIDMSILANEVGVKDKFWVVGYSSGGMHAWAALRYIPDRLAGAAMFAPFVNPYDSLMTKQERAAAWKPWTRRRKFMYFLARHFPSLLAHFYCRSFLSGKHGQIDSWLSLSLGNRDKALLEDPIYEEFWQRDVEESTRQRNTKPFIEEAHLQVSNWGFTLQDIRLKKKQPRSRIINWLKSLLSLAQDEYTGFVGPIHLWQGTEDTVVPPVMADFTHRILPGAAVHKLPYEGHFTYFYFCDECHRQIFTALFGAPRGALTGSPLEGGPPDSNATQILRTD